MAQTESRGSEPLSPVVWKTSIAVICGVFMSILDLTIVNVALETLGRDLGSGGIDDAQWVMTAYMLAVAAVIPVTGWASDRIGGRRLFLASLVAFTAASALCAVAWDIWSLVAFRTLQGIAGGALMPAGQILLARAAGPHQMGRVMGVIGVPMLLAPVLGPVIGGLILDSLPWEWIFLVNVPVGILGFILTLRLVPADDEEERAKHSSESALDVTGLITLALGFPLLVYGLANIAGHGLDATRSWLPMAAGLVLVAWFVRHASRHRAPLLDLSLFRNHAYAHASITFFALGAFLFGSIVLLPLYFQIVRAEDVLHTGLLLAPQGLGAALGIALTGRLTDRVGGGPIVIGGLIVLFVGTLPFTQLDASTSYWLLGGAMFVRGIGFGSTMMPAMAAAYATLTPADISHATPQINILRQIGGAVGTALLATILNAEIGDRLGDTGGPALGGEGSAAGAAGPLPLQIAEQLSQAFASTFWWVLVGTALSIVPALFLARAEHRARLARRATNA